MLDFKTNPWEFFNLELNENEPIPDKHEDVFKAIDRNQFSYLTDYFDHEGLVQCKICKIFLLKDQILIHYENRHANPPPAIVNPIENVSDLKRSNSLKIVSKMMIDKTKINHSNTFSKKKSSSSSKDEHGNKLLKKSTPVCYLEEKDKSLKIRIQFDPKSSSAYNFVKTQEKHLDASKYCCYPDNFGNPCYNSILCTIHSLEQKQQIARSANLFELINTYKKNQFLRSEKTQFLPMPRISSSSSSSSSSSCPNILIMSNNKNDSLLREPNLSIGNQFRSTVKSLNKYESIKQDKIIITSKNLDKSIGTIPRLNNNQRNPSTLSQITSDCQYLSHPYKDKSSEIIKQKMQNIYYPQKHSGEHVMTKPQSYLPNGQGASINFIGVNDSDERLHHENELTARRIYQPAILSTRKVLQANNPSQSCSSSATSLSLERNQGQLPTNAPIIIRKNSIGKQLEVEKNSHFYKTIVNSSHINTISHRTKPLDPSPFRNSSTNILHKFYDETISNISSSKPNHSTNQMNRYPIGQSHSNTIMNNHYQQPMSLSLNKKDHPHSHKSSPVLHNNMTDFNNSGDSRLISFDNNKPFSNPNTFISPKSNQQHPHQAMSSSNVTVYPHKVGGLHVTNSSGPSRYLHEKRLVSNSLRDLSTPLDSVMNSENKQMNLDDGTVLKRDYVNSFVSPVQSKQRRVVVSNCGKPSNMLLSSIDTRHEPEDFKTDANEEFYYKSVQNRQNAQALSKRM